MATKKYVKDVQKEKGKFGHYKTGTGGGEPIPAGKKWTNEKRDPDQARDDQGRFTYNAVNGKPLKDISKVHGHSRGTTIPPTLTGGIGGIHYYSDSSHDHIVKGGQDALEKFTSLTFEEAYRKGDKLIGFDGKVAIASKDFIESASEYIANKKQEKKLSGALAELAEAKKGGKKEDIDAAVDKVLSFGHYSEEPTGSWKRKEAETPEEKAALAKAETEKTEGRELVERKREEEVEAAPKRKSSVASYLRKSGSSGYVAPEVPTSSVETGLESGASISDFKMPSDIDDETISKLVEATGESADDLKEAISSGVFSKEEIDELLKPESPEAKETAEDVKEEIKEEGIKTVDDLSEQLKSENKEDVVEAIYKDESIRNAIRKFAKQWASDKPEVRDLSDIELTIKFIDSIYEGHKKSEKDEAMKEFGIKEEK